MASCRRRVFWSGILTIVLSSSVLTENSERDVDSILEEINYEYKNFEIGEEKNIILVLGNTGTGKSTLALLLSGAYLEAKRVSPGVFSIEDKNDLISGHSTTVSKTKVPNLMVDKETNTNFYDCPGFADSRGVVIDIIATRSIHKLLKFANEIKLLITVSYQSVLNVIGDRKSLNELAGHIIRLMKNFEKYTKGMTMVVTKVQNLKDFNDEGEEVLVDDATVIESIANFINQTKCDLQSKSKNKMTFEERRLNELKIKFFEIFLERESNKYTRINIFRLVDRPGPLKKMKIIENEREAINTAINYYTDYVSTKIDDFGYSISDESSKYVAKLITKLEDNMEKYASIICKDLKLFYNDKTQPINSVKNIKTAIGVDNLFQLHSNVEFIKYFNQSMVSLDININADIFENISRSIEFVDFLYAIENESPSISKRMEGTLKLCASELLDEVNTRLRIDVTNAIFDIQQNYVEGHSDSKVLNKLQTVFSVGLDDASGLNSSVLRSILDLTSDGQVSLFSRNMEFFDFLQLLNDKDHIEVSRELKECVKKTESKFLHSVHNIFDGIEAFYVQEEKKNYLNFEDIKMKMSMIQQKLSIVGTNSLEIFVKDLFTIATDLNSGQHMNILREIEFLKCVNGNLSISEKILNDLNTFKKYVDDSKIWYSFLLKLLDHLMTYNVQHNPALRDAGEELLTINNEDYSDYSKIELKLILDSLDEKLFTDVIENMKINVFKLNALKAVWSQTMGNFKISCMSDRLTVKGYVISISNVVKLDCWPNAKFIDIFALNKIFIDADIVKNSKRVELSIISPIWEIVASSTKKTQIQLQGEHGIDYTAEAGLAEQIWTKSKFGDFYKATGRNGENGLPGKPGGPGGCVLIIGGSFINSDRLLIDTSGGEGGEGQIGGDGENGIEGESPVRGDVDNPSSMYHSIEDSKCYVIFEENIFIGNKKRYKCYGKKGTQGGRGGSGGCGGFGGNPGKISVIGLDEMPKFDIVKEIGETGARGDGGLGGRATRYGGNFEVFKVSVLGQASFKIENEELGHRIPAGEDGDDGTNCNGIENPVKVKDFATFQASSITAYQEYARKKFLNNIWRANLEHFVNGLTNNETLDSFFNIITLIEEFISLEKNYFEMRKNIDFAPFHQSLKNRIERFVKRIGESSDERKSVKLLYTAVISKLLSMKNQANQIAVSDLLTYIATVKVNIGKLKKVERIEYITQQRLNYERTLDEKFKSATQLVHKMVVPAIDKIFGEIERKIQELLSEAVVKHNENEEALEKAKANKEKFKKMLSLHNTLAPFKLIGSFLPLAGPEGAIVGAAVSSGATFAESVIDGGLKSTNIQSPAAPYKKLITKINNDFNRQQLLFSEQLSDLDKISSAENSTDFKEIRKVVKAAQKIIKFDKNFQSNFTNELEIGKKAIQNALTETKSYYNVLKKDGKDVDSAIGNIETMGKILKVADVGVDIYKRNRHDNQKLDAIIEQIENLHVQLNTWQQYEENIKQIMMPQLKEMQLSFEKSSKNLAGRSHVVLDISKWKIQGALSDLKKLFREMAQAQDSLLEGDLVHLIEKVSEGITTMISVYDRIDSYVEQSKLAALISDFTAGPTYIGDPTLRKKAFTLDKIIQTNLVLERFESVMHALKQHKFPYARQYLQVFYNLPSGLQSDDTKDVLQRVTENIDDLQNKLIISKSTLQISDVNTFSDRYFDSMQPFYIWHHHDFKSDIQQLLNGTQITLTSDISKGVHFNAVKFKEISINFKLANETRQREFDKELEMFEIVMTMVGNNYYRCNNRIYYISMDKDVVLIFHMRNGTVFGKNDIYQKISDSDYFLSPYTVWNIQLTSLASQSQISGNFKSFKYDKIELQLTGVGQIIKDKIKNELEVCSNDLDNYYTIDGIY